jgi:hypothetical protein
VADANAPSGSVIQVVSADVATRYTVTSGSFASVGPTISITPKDTSSRFLLLWSGSIQMPAYSFFTFFRNGTNVSLADGIMTYSGASGWDYIAYSYLDSPNSSSSITYQLAMRSNSGTININDYGSTMRSQLIAMEIAA